MKKIPKIFKPNINHEINNNKNVFYSFKEENDRIDERKETPEETLDRLINDNSYIFSKKIVIYTKDGNFETKIAGRLGNNIVTLDGKSINIDDVIEIREK